METIPCITNKCLKYPTCKYKKYIKCEELHIYYKKLYIHYKKNSNQHDIFNNVYFKAIEHIQTSLPNLKMITGIWNDIYTEHIYTEHIQKSLSSLKEITKRLNNA